MFCLCPYLGSSSGVARAMLAITKGLPCRAVRWPLLVLLAFPSRSLATTSNCLTDAHCASACISGNGATCAEAFCNTTFGGMVGRCDCSGNVLMRGALNNASCEAIEGSTPNVQALGNTTVALHPIAHDTALPQDLLGRAIAGVGLAACDNAMISVIRLFDQRSLRISRI
eukprot:s347_g22.t1